ncbi:hypothetical protein MY10362_006116 [Beauveria mimosiformis]
MEPNEPDHMNWHEDQKLRWCETQMNLINAALEAEDYLTALHFCDVALRRLEYWPKYSSYVKLIYLHKSSAYRGLAA